MSDISLLVKRNVVSQHQPSISVEGGNGGGGRLLPIYHRRETTEGDDDYHQRRKTIDKHGSQQTTERRHILSFDSAVNSVHRFSIGSIHSTAADELPLSSVNVKIAAQFKEIAAKMSFNGRREGTQEKLLMVMKLLDSKTKVMRDLKN